MKLPSRLIIVLGICLLALSSLTSPILASSPTIELSEDEGYVGDEIEVSGEGFHAGDSVYIYYDEELLPSDATTVKSGCCQHRGKFAVDITIPESCRGHHDIVAKGGSKTDSAGFTVKPKITLDESSGHVGDIIELKGCGFPSEGTGIKLRYYLDTNSHSERDSSPHVDFPVADVNSSGSWEQTFSVPASKKGAHCIDAYYDDDEGTLSQVNNDAVRFKVKPIITLNPDSGCSGDTITISGAGFVQNESDIKLRYDGTEELAAGDADEYGSWELSFPVPPCAKGSHVIKAFYGSSSAAIASATFTVAPGIFLNPAAGHVGQSFSVSGSAFDPDIVVTINYQDQMANATTNADGNFSAGAFTAKGEHGEQHVTATYGGDSVHPAIFYMEEIPPGKPELSSPIDSKRTGFFGSFTGKIRPKFKWLDVTDASGIASYDLQVSTSPDFSAPIASLSINGKNPGSTDDAVAYTLPREHSLSRGSYYWRVKATDAAANEGDWSEAQSFRAGWLPQWAMIAITAALLLLIIIISLAIRRRREYYY